MTTPTPWGIPPPICPRCGAERNGVQENLVLFACGSIFMRDKIGFTVMEPAKCKSMLMEDKPRPNLIAEEMTRRIPEPQVDILLEVKRDAWRRGAEAMRTKLILDCVDARVLVWMEGVALPDYTNV